MDINNLEMAVKLLAWLVFEGIIVTENLRYKHFGLFLARLLPFLCIEYNSDFWFGYKRISDVRMEATLDHRGSLWRLCRVYCKPLGIDPNLEETDFQTKIRFATGFSVHMRKGSQARGKQVHVGTVYAALGGVNANISLDKGRQSLL